LEPIDNHSSTGRVFVGGDDWRAVSENNETIPMGAQVIVKRVESNRLHVESLGRP
jgi:membrane protein implicated in regulation of membrane protease activity